MLIAAYRKFRNPFLGQINTADYKKNAFNDWIRKLCISVGGEYFEGDQIKVSLKSVTNTFLCVEIHSYLNNPRIHAYANKKYADIHQSSCIHVAFYHVHYDLFYSLRCIITFSPFLQRGIWGWSGGAMVLGKLPCRGLLLFWGIVWQGLTAIAVGAGGGGLDIFSLDYHFSLPLFGRRPDID